MNLLVGIDDTDSPDGMCTTYLGLEMIATAIDDLDLIGLPRLVRLNPCIPWRTRGNGAVAFELGEGAGEPRRIGEFKGMDILSYPDGEDAGKTTAITERLEALLDSRSLTDEGASPGLVVSQSPLPPSLYWRGVRDVVDGIQLSEMLERTGCEVRGIAGGRGIVGASCAIAWPMENTTFEAMSYRLEERWGSKRELDRDAVSDLDCKYGTFNSFDHATGKVLISPNTPCPVLAGVRGESAESVFSALTSVQAEPSESSIIWITNQGTDDHITNVETVADVRPCSSISLSGTVASDPRTERGGHVFFELSDGSNLIDCASFEPTKDMRDIVRQLRTGDSITVLGGVTDGACINIEKLRIDAVVDRYIKRENPICHRCGRRMKSKGMGAGYRCPDCRTTVDEEHVERSVLPAPEIGWYEAVLSAQRHLTLPLSRMGRTDGDLLRRHRERGPEDLRDR